MIWRLQRRVWAGADMMCCENSAALTIHIGLVRNAVVANHREREAEQLSGVRRICQCEKGQ